LLVNSRFFAVADNDFSDAVARQAMPCISKIKRRKQRGILRGVATPGVQPISQSLNSRRPLVHHLSLRPASLAKNPLASYWLGQSRGQLTNFISSQSITQKQALQSIIVLTKQIFCALALYDGQRRNGLILSSPVLNQVAHTVFYTHQPELSYRNIQPGETRLVLECSKIW